jgi:methylmalonyl-CoA mutase N-terminal domain/subunit
MTEPEEEKRLNPPPLEEEYHYWQQTSYTASLKQQEQRQTESGIPVKPLYIPSDVAGLDYMSQLGFPGQPPYTRGIHPGMYHGRQWTIRQLVGFGTAEDTNQRIRLLLAQGATGTNTVFDYATNRGYNSDAPVAEGDVGQGGVAIDCLDDMLQLYEGIPLDTVSNSLVLSHPVAAGVIFAMYLAAAEQRGYDWSQLAGTLQNDFLMETVVLTAPNILQPSFSFKLSTDVIEFATQHVPKWNPISFTGYNYRETGANAVQEVGLVIAHALAAAQEMLRRGYDIDAFAPRLSSFFSADNDFFEEIAKYRAARRVYAHLFQERLHAQNPRSMMLRFHVQTAGSALTAQQPLNNITRAAYHALAAVLGGAQSLHVSAYDEALCIPSEIAALTALRTQQILLLETGASSTIDPLAGSYYVESLTNEMEKRITEYIEKIDHLGGLVAAVQQGWVHRDILQNAYERELAIADGTRSVVGVNCFADTTAPPIEIFRVPETLERQQVRLTRLRASRDTLKVEHTLELLRKAAQGNENTLPVLLDAVKYGASLGECCDVFRSLFGGWHQPLA